MKRNLYTLLFSFALPCIFYLSGQAQSCSDLQVTYTTSESRCMATGAITVQASGGSGSYNYKVAGPVTTSFTSSNVITGLQPGTYTIIVRDITRNCEAERAGAVVSGSYSDPRFVLSKTDVTCAGNDGTISVANQQFGRQPLTYTIIAPSPQGVGTTSTTGTFTNLIAGAYAVQLRDSCGGIQVRRVTIESYAWWYDGVDVTKTTCDSAQVLIRLRDSKGNLNTASVAFAGFTYGKVNAPGDTSWYSVNSFSVYTGSRLSLTFVAKDPCGRVHPYTWQVPANQKPSVSGININNRTCTDFTAAVQGVQNLTNPVYTLYDNANTKLDSNGTGTFSNIPYGRYCIHIRDACYDTTIVRCFTENQPVPNVSNTVIIGDRACATFRATITGQSGLINPTYCLYDSTNVQLACNSSGVFANLLYGSYCIQVTDGCTGTVLTRCFSAAKPAPVLSGVSISGQSCSGFDATGNGSNLINPQFCLYDSLGNVIACNSTGVFPGIENGRYCMRAISCGDTTAPVCFTRRAPQAAVDAAVQLTNRVCSTFTATITGQINLTAPTYCLFDSVNVQLACNATGVFDNLAYGSYCIRVTDSCVDTTIVRCFTASRPRPSVSASLQKANPTCATFTARVTGQQNLYNPQYCIYNAADSLIACNSTGVFDTLPYGRYCVVVTDGCSGDTLRVCQTFSYEHDISLTSSRSCSFGSTDLYVYFNKGTGPYAIRLYGPRDSLITYTTVTTTKRFIVPALAAGETYKVTSMDACGKADTATIVPVASIVTKSISATGKCPSASWLNGSGDLSITAASNLGIVTPRIIKKDGVTFSRTHSSNAGTSYMFSDLEPAQYIVEYSVQNCSGKLYDTFALHPYTYPTQGRSAIYQCDNQSLSLTADVSGGVGPYIYQIIGSVPDTPALISPEQSSPYFNINNGTTYSLIRLRTIDACGNATLNDVSVLPLQNFFITTDTPCLFTEVNLSVDTLAGATYSWYKKRSATDSVFLSHDISYHIPFMLQQDIGTYVCKVELNNSCLTRLASYALEGYCGEIYLAVPFTLTGKAETSGNVLRWNVAEPHAMPYFQIERKTGEHGSYAPIGRVAASGQAGARYQFTDTAWRHGAAIYRIKTALPNGTFDYSNSINLQRAAGTTAVYPNPVRTELTIQLSGTAAQDYRIELHTMAGHLVYKHDLKNVTSMQHRYKRPASVPTGLYLLKIINRNTGAVTHYKIIFD